MENIRYRLEVVIQMNLKEDMFINIFRNTNLDISDFETFETHDNLTVHFLVNIKFPIQNGTHIYDEAN